MRYALIRSGKVVNTIEAAPEFVQQIADQYDAVIQSDEASIGWTYDAAAATFTPPSTEETWSLSIQLNKDVAAPGETVTATADVRDSQGQVVPVNGTYYVRIVNPLGATAKLLKVDFVDGQAQSTFSLNVPDIYTIDMNSIKPRPRARLAKSVELIIST